jgi:predicted nucleic acid-binding protein
MFLLDTNVISELRKAGDGKADPNVVAWLSGVDATALYLSAITLMEIELGILRLERRDPSQAKKLRAWMDDQILPEFSERTLSVDTAVALRCARLHVPDARSERDALIAATALVHGMTVITRNFDDFAPTGALVINPWG